MILRSNNNEYGTEPTAIDMIPSTFQDGYELGTLLFNAPGEDLMFPLHDALSNPKVKPGLVLGYLVAKKTAELIGAHNE